MELISRYNPVIWVECMGDCFGKMEYVIEELYNICIMVGDIISSVAWVAGYGGTSCCGEKSCDDVRLGLTQSGS